MWKTIRDKPYSANNLVIIRSTIIEQFRGKLYHNNFGRLNLFSDFNYVPGFNDYERFIPQQSQENPMSVNERIQGISLFENPESWHQMQLANQGNEQIRKILSPMATGGNPLLAHCYLDSKIYKYKTVYYKIIQFQI